MSCNSLLAEALVPPPSLHPTMPLEPPPASPTESPSTWKADPSVLTWRFGSELVTYHLRASRSYRLPNLPDRVRELLETGYELEVTASDPVPGSPETSELPQSELDRLLKMLEREQLIRPAGEVATGATRRSDHGDLFLIIAADKGGSKEVSPQEARVPLRVSTVLQRAPKVVIELMGGRIRVSPGGHQGQAIDGGAHALRLLDAFERPRTVQEVVRVLQSRAREVQGWIGLIEALVRLYEGGALCTVAVKQGAKVE